MPFNSSRAKSRRCTYCAIQYPPNVDVCQVCGHPTWDIYKTGPDDDWRDKVSRLRGALAEPEDEPQIAYAPRHPADVQIALHVADGRLWIPHAVLLDAGYSHLEDGGIVFVNNRFYELLGYSESRGMWWVEGMELDGIFDEITPEDIINGGEDE